MKHPFSLLCKWCAIPLAWLASLGIISQPIVLAGMLASMMLMPAPAQAQARYCSVYGLNTSSYTLTSLTDIPQWTQYALVQCTSGYVGSYLCVGAQWADAFNTTAYVSFLYTGSGSGTSGSGGSVMFYASSNPTEAGDWDTGYRSSTGTTSNQPTAANPMNVTVKVTIGMPSNTNNFSNISPGTYGNLFYLGFDFNGSGTCDQWTNTVIGTVSQDSAYQPVGVTYIVPNFCSITSTAPVAFGSIASTASAVNAQGSVSAKCNGSNGYTVSLGNGNNYSNGRRMASSGGGYLPYTLYTDSAHTNPWTSSTTVTTATPTAGTAVATPIYAQIPAGTALPAAGSYSDTVTVTISY